MSWMLFVACLAAVATELTADHSHGSVDLLDRCITSTNHKAKPGPESSAVMKEFHCSPWRNHSCCTNNTSAKIGQDGLLSLYNMLLDQCPQKKVLSDRCRRHFVRDTCFYECSPNLAPWIVEDTVSKITRKERAMHIPLCSRECDAWFNDCYDDYTCNDNWLLNWNWKKRGTPEMCTKPCKKFRHYFANPVEFCEKIFNYSYKYSREDEGCMTMWPEDKQSENKKFALQVAEAKLHAKTGSGSISLGSSLPALVSLLLLSVMLHFS